MIKMYNFDKLDFVVKRKLHNKVIFKNHNPKSTRAVSYNTAKRHLENIEELLNDFPNDPILLKEQKRLFSSSRNMVI